MPASSRRLIVTWACPKARTVTATASTDAGTARTATGLTGAFSTITTAAVLASKMPVGSYMNTPANILSVSQTAMGSTVNALVAVLKELPNDTTLTGLTMTVGGAVYIASVSTIAAFVDEGLTADAQLAGVTGLMTALSTAVGEAV